MYAGAHPNTQHSADEPFHHVGPAGPLTFAALAQPIRSRMWWQWVLASVVAGLGSELAMGERGQMPWTALAWVSSKQVVTIILLVSIIQSMMLRHRVRATFWWAFTGPVALAASFATAAVLANPLGLLLQYRWPLGEQLAMALGIGIAAVWLGGLQAWYLEISGVREAGWWMLACLLGVGGGAALGAYLPLPFLGSVGTFGLVSGMVTATGIGWLLPSDIPEEQDAHEPSGDGV